MQPKGKAIASMSVGIVATSISVIAMILPFFWMVAGILTGVIAVICGIIAIVLSNRSLHRDVYKRQHLGSTGYHKVLLINP